MKAQAKIVDLLGVLLLIVVLLVFLTQLPKLVSSFYTLLSLYLPEVVSRDLAGLVSISAATPANITILYEGAIEAITYDVVLENRNLTATMRSEGEIATKLVDGKMVPLAAWETYCVDGLRVGKGEIENKRKFEIDKRRVGLTSLFSFKGIE